MKLNERVRESNDPRLTSLDATTMAAFKRSQATFYINSRSQIWWVGMVGRFTSEDIENLFLFKNLVQLTLGNPLQMSPSTTDSVVMRLVDLPKLSLLNLDNCDNITGLSLSYISRNKWIQFCTFRNCPIHDEHLHYLEDLTHLIVLDLSRTKNTDNSIGNLCQLKNLRRLGLKHCDIRKRSILHLQSSLPNCKILV